MFLIFASNNLIYNRVVVSYFLLGLIRWTTLLIKYYFLGPHGFSQPSLMEIILGWMVICQNGNGFLNSTLRKVLLEGLRLPTHVPICGTVMSKTLKEAIDTGGVQAPSSKCSEKASITLNRAAHVPGSLVCMLLWLYKTLKWQSANN